MTGRNTSAVTGEVGVTAAPALRLLSTGTVMAGLTLGLTAAGLLAVLGLAAAVPGEPAAPTTARIALVVTYPLVAVGAVLLATHATVSDESDRRPALWAFVVATLGVLVAAARLARSIGQPVGAGSGADRAAGTPALTSTGTGWSELLLVAEMLLTVVVAVLAVTVAIALGRSVLGTGRPDVRLSIGVTLVGLAHVLVSTTGGRETVDAVASIAATLGASMFLLSALTLARGTLHAQRTAAIDLAEQLRESRAAHSQARERLHALANSVAGITSAHRLLQSHHELPEDYRRRLEAMVAEEADRLDDLLRARPSEPQVALPGPADDQPARPDGPVTAAAVRDPQPAAALATVSHLGAARRSRVDDGLTLGWSTSKKGGEHRVADGVSAQ